MNPLQLMVVLDYLCTSEPDYDMAKKLIDAMDNEKAITEVIDIFTDSADYHQWVQRAKEWLAKPKKKPVVVSLLIHRAW